MGVRDAVGVADKAAIKTCMRAVLAADVEATARSVVGVEDGTVAVGSGVSETKTVGGEVRLGAMVSTGGGVRSVGEGDIASAVDEETTVSFGA
jgi:hypothetical protein